MAINRITRKLERLELEHLRQHVADLHDELAQENDSAEFWQNYVLQNYALQLQDMQADADFATHRAIGITKSGETMVVKL